MSYCTAANVKVYVGTTVSDADLTAMIVDADRDILAYFTASGETIDSDVAKSASILLVRAAVAQRFYLTGENPTSYSAGDYSQSGAADQLKLAQDLKAEAFRVMDECFSNDVSYETEESVTRSDALMDDFKLDQSEQPTFFTELT